MVPVSSIGTVVGVRGAILEPSGYQVQYLAPGPLLWVDGPLVTGTEATVTGLANATTYDFRVVAVNGVGDSESSDVVRAAPFEIAADALTKVAGSTMNPGSTFDLDLADLPAGATVTVELHSTPIVLGTGTVGADGRFRGTFAIPASAELGAHTVVLTVSGAGLATASRSAAVTVAAVPSALAVSGADMESAAFALLLLLGGAALAQRRRRHAA